ncbi:MAG: S8 family serine peptidase [Candidatus Aenigmarchaeota archaeon]|nr:S8 family serine peptidase [Candidatus Aenigmarchaeota archaeon]
MKTELLLVSGAFLIIISAFVLGTAAGGLLAGGHDPVGTENAPGDANPHGNPLLMRPGSNHDSPEIMGSLLDRMKAEYLFNGSDMRRRFLGIRVPLEDEEAADALPPHAPGELIVKLRPGASFGPAPPDGMAGALIAGVAEAGPSQSLDELNARYGAVRITRVFGMQAGQENQKVMKLKAADSGEQERHDGLSRIYRLELEDDADVASAVMEYGENPLVEYAEPNYIYRAFDAPNDASFYQQWTHTLMESGDAWDIEQGDHGIIIAIIDTGVDWDHPDLAGNIWNNTDEDCNESTDLDGNGIYGDCRGYDFVDSATASGCIDADCEDEDNDPMDGHGHGTHCSGIAAAVTDNSIGVAGVCRNCTVMAVRAGFKHPLGGVLKEDDIAQALEYAVKNSADIISMSFGGEHSSMLQEAMDDAYASGAILIAAAGNDDTDSMDSSYPAAYGNVIAVSATKNDDKKASYSNYGYWVDVAAPGGDSPSAPSTAILSTMVDDTYASWMGTSMACPHVAGLAGLILSRNSSFSQQEVRKIIKSSTDPVDHDEYMGFGRINLRMAMQIDEVPASDISSLSFGEVVEGSVDILGTASGGNFINYTLSYGSGAYPPSWNTINFSTIEENGGKLGSWDTTNEPDGLYSVLLHVHSSGGWSQDRVVVRVLNNGTTCVSCEDCEYKINNYQNASLFFLDGDISSTDGDCIGIYRDDVTLNCDYSNITGQGEGSGILVESDDVDIRNCVLENFQYGIFLDFASGSTLKNNSMNGNGVGLWVSGSAGGYFDHDIDAGNEVDNRPVNYYYDADDQFISLGKESGHLEAAYSDNVTITGNSVFGDGIKLDRVTGSLIEDNTVSDAKAGIFIDGGSSGNNFTGNSISKSQDYQQGIYFEDFDSLFNDIDESNTVNSEPLLHFHDDHGTQVSPITASPLALTVPNVTNVGRIMAVNSSFVNLSGFDLSGSFYGIYAYQSANLSIASNTIEGNEGGILLIETDDSSVTDNEVHDNVLVGIFTSDSENNSIEGNNVTGTSSCLFDFIIFGIPFSFDFGGIGVGDAGSTIRWNNVSGNNCTGISVKGDGNEVQGNTIDGNKGGLYVGGSYNEFSSNQVTNHFGRYGLFVESYAATYNHINQSNTVNGEPLHYYYDVHGTESDPVTLGSIDLHELNASNIGKITIINSSHVNITNANLSLNGFGVYVLDSHHVGLQGSEISGVGYGYAIQNSDGSSVRGCNITGADFSGLYLQGAGDLVVTENNIMQTALQGEEPVHSDEAIELSYQGSGNFWGRTEPPYFIPGTDSNYGNVTDSNAYGTPSGWEDGDPPGLAFSYPTLPDGNYTNLDWLFINVSADENLTACLLEWEDSGSNVSMSMVKDGEDTYCYMNMTGLGGGWFYYTVYADDPSGNLNSTPRRSARVNSPPGISSASVMPHLLLSGETLSITADVTDTDGLSHVLYNMSGDSGSQSGQMQPLGGSAYGANASAALPDGYYDVGIFANDTLGAGNETVIDVMEIRPASQITLLFRDHLDAPMNMSLSVISPSDGHVRESAQTVTNHSFQVPQDNWDLNLSRGFWITLHYAFFIDDLTATFSIDDVPPQLVEPPADKQFRSVIAAETNLSFVNAHITVPYSGLITDESAIVAYKCGSWNMSQRHCAGGASGWGNKLDEGDDYSLDKARDMIILNATAFSAYAVGEEYCGNGVVDDQAEECDGGDMDGETCDSLGYDYGSLGCTGSCLFDTSDCHNSGGGNGYTTSSIQIADYPSSITIIQGGSKSVNVGVRNNGYSNLTGVSLSAATDCSECQFLVTPSSRSMGPGTSGNFSLSITVPYTQNLGAFGLDLSASSDQQASASVRTSLVVQESKILCTPGAVKCSLTGNLVQCNTAGDAWETSQVCPNGCEGGACSTLCTGGHLRCSGSMLQQCRSDGSQWEDKEKCQNGCDPATLTCKAALMTQPAIGERRCSGGTVQQYLEGGWMIVEECAIGCENSTCVAGGMQPIGFDFGLIALVVVAVIIIGGAGYFYYTRSMKELSWESLEHKWEIIETNSAELLSNAEHFLDKKVRLSGRISQTMQEQTGIMGSTLEDQTGQVLVFSNPPGPKGRVELTGFVGQNEFGEVFVQVESFKTDWLWFISMLQSLKMDVLLQHLQRLRAMIGEIFRKGVRKK